MITKLDHKHLQIARQILTVQIPSYRVEAELLQTDQIPRLYDSVIDVLTCDEVFLGCFQKDRLIGFISFKKKRGNLVDIHRLVVDPAYFRQGVAKSLLSSLFKRFPNSTFIVTTGKGNSPAQTLYENEGFIQTGVTQAAPNLWINHYKRLPE
ncbi:GNAT family N-acetyltransferase [Halobacillus hunanensis]|uniref:GNAT family N-acetyltransferase n=1 Tax=Halobacillus hunanensis TaxID=578214 RepID=UPI0009A65EB5|nr:GNAT family N-acetyltransferase [Halobacillus hunanensis]